VSHSFIDHSSTSLSTSIAVSTTNNSFIQRNTYQIQFFVSFHCNAEIPLSVPLSTIEQPPQNSPHPTIEMTETQTQNETHLIEQTPFETQRPVQSPLQTFTPYYTYNPERTNQRSLDVDLIDRTPLISNYLTNNSGDESISNAVIVYSIVGLLMITAVLISIIIRCQRNQNRDDHPSSSSK